MEREAMPLLPSQGGRRAVSRRSAIVVAALAAVAVVAVAVLSRHGAPLALYQIGSKTFSQVARMSVEDMAADVRRMLAMEKKTLDSIDARAAKHQKVQVKLVAGQVSPRSSSPRCAQPCPDAPAPRLDKPPSNTTLKIFLRADWSQRPAR